MIKNYFYLIVGILSVLSAVTHTWNGLETALPVLDSAEIGGGTRTVFTYVWHVIGVESLVLGAALIVMAFIKNRDNVRFTAFVIIAILIMRWLVISIFTIMGSESSIIDILPDTITILVVVVLLFLGTRIKNKNNK